jgi:flagellar protein FlaJ
MSMMGEPQTMLLYGTVYGLIPLTGMGFLVLTSTVTQDSIGDGYLRPSNADDEFIVDEGLGLLNLGLIEDFTGEFSVFDRIKRQEGTYEALQILKRPDLFFRDHPLFVLGVTGPLTLLVLVGAILNGWAPLSIEGMVNNPVSGTFFWVHVPTYLNLLPLAIFYEWNVRSRKTVIGKLSENLRKLASANDTGMTLLESIKVVSETSAGKLSHEFEIMHAKVNYGTSLKDALREFNNKFHVPRLARTVKLISEAQEASNQIQNVLSTAAQSSENQDDIDRERISRTRMQVVIILMTYLTLLGVMALLKVEFLDVMTGLSSEASGASSGQAAGSGFGGGIDTQLLSMLFFHAVTLQAFLSAFIAGYIRDVNILSGVKFAVVLNTIALIVWMAVG